MITITQDSELMKNLIPAETIPAGDHFVAFKDDSSDPAVLTLGSDHKLNLVITTNGTPSWTDFGKSSGLFSEGTNIQAFDVKQAPDLGLNICITTEANNGQSDFLLIHGIKPSELLKPVALERTIRGKGFPEIYHIYMSNLYGKEVNSTPLIFLAFKRPDRIINEEDLGYVTYAKSRQSGYTASLDRSWKLATNPERIIDVDFGTHKLGTGAFVLYEAVNATKKLQFKVFTNEVTFVAEAQCPNDATCLASFLDPDTEHSVLLVGGEKITAYQPSEYVSPKQHGTIITTNDPSLGLKDIHVSTLGDELRVWYTTMANGAHYYTTKISTLSKGRLVPLLADGQGGQISGLLSLRPRDRQDLPVSSLVSVRNHTDLLLLQQDPKSGVWEQFPFFHFKADTKVIEVYGYTLRLQAKALSDSGNSGSVPDETLVPACWLRVSSSGVIRCIVNGRTASLNTTGQWFQTDAQGVLNIVFATEDASCYKLRTEAFRPAKTSETSSSVRLLDVPTLDPTRKIVRRLDGINTEQDLRAAKTQSGELLITKASDSDVKQAATAIQLLREQIKYFDNEDEKSLKAYKNNVLTREQDTKTIADFLSWDDFTHWAGEKLKWLYDNVKEDWNWLVDKIEEGGRTLVRLVITIAEETYKIVLDCVSAVVQAVSWVFKKLGVLIQKLIDFLGFLFSWDDILDTTDSMVTMLNAGLDYGEHLLTQTETDVKNWLQSLKKTIKTQLPVLAQHDFTRVGVAGNTQQKTLQIQVADNRDKDAVAEGVGYHWASYQLQYGGTMNIAALKDSSTKNSDSEKIKEIWDEIQAELKTIQIYAKKLLKDFVELFKDGKFDFKALIAKILADTVDAVMNSLTHLSGILFKAAELGISMVRELCKYEIKVPVFTWLWKLVGKGRPFNLGNFVSLLVAIPATVLYKAVKGKAPPKLKGRVTKSTFQEYVESGSVSHDQSLAGDISTFNMSAAVGAGTILFAATTITLIVDGVFESAGLESYSNESPVQSSYARGKAVPPQPYLALPNWVGNAIDGVSIILESGALVYSWPLRKHILELSPEIQACYWGAWLLDASNVAAIVVTRAIGAYQDIPRVESKRWRGTLAAITNIPIFVLQMSCHVAEKDAEHTLTADSKVFALTTPQFTRHILESWAEMASQWGFAVAAWTDEADNEFMWIGLAAFAFFKGADIGLETADFVLEKNM